jgi:hypothetical protein
MNESPVLVHIWAVEPAQERLAVEHLNRMFGTLVTDPDFVSARVLQSADQASIAAVVEMQSVEARRRLEQREEVREALDHLPGSVNVVLRLYHEVSAYRA